MQWNARSEQLQAYPGFLRAICQLGRGLVNSYGHSPRASSMFASQQRWLISHIAMKLYFRGLVPGEAGLTDYDFVQAVVGHELASRNTARALLAEAVKYGFVRPSVRKSSRRPLGGMAPLEMTELGVGLLAEWVSLHLRALDALDGGRRQSCFSDNPPAALAVMEPYVCDELVSCMDVRNPGPAYAHFTWMDQGGLLMDRLMAGIDPDAAAPEQRSATDVVSIAELARSFGLSRSHVARKLVDGEHAGHIGWSARRGHSAMWISGGFRRDYARAQALKMVIIDAAFALTLAA
jgi:hypothetical protein